MSNRETDEARLLADIFSSEWETGIPRLHAQGAASYARRRRVTRVAVALTLPIALALTFLIGTAHLREQRRAALSRLPASPGRSYELLSDADVLAQVHDRPLLALRDGEQIREIVVLDDQ